MTALSYRTEGLLIEILSRWSHGEIGTLLRKVNLARFDPGQGTKEAWINKDRRLQLVFDAARGYDDEQTARDMLDLVVQVANATAGDPNHMPAWFTKFREHVLSDGYELTPTIEHFDNGWDRRSTATYRLLPAGAGPAPVAPEITALEAELETRGYDVARTHYGQAVRNYVSGDLEASNGQLRSFLEDLLVVLAHYHAGFTGGDPVAAIQQLQYRGKLLDGENNLLRGLWTLSQERGAHRGVTDAAEALFRLQSTTSICRFLLRHLS